MGEPAALARRRLRTHLAAARRARPSASTTSKASSPPRRHRHYHILHHQVRIILPADEAAAQADARLAVLTAPLGALRRGAAPRGAAAAAEALRVELLPLRAAGGGEPPLPLPLRAADGAFVGALSLRRLLGARFWRVRASLRTPQVRRLALSSSACFGISSGPTAATAGAAGAGPAAEERVRVQCVPCDPAAPPVRPACPEQRTSVESQRGDVVSCPEWFTVEVARVAKAELHR